MIQMKVLLKMKYHGKILFLFKYRNKHCQISITNETQKKTSKQKNKFSSFKVCLHGEKTPFFGTFKIRKYFILNLV